MPEIKSLPPSVLADETTVAADRRRPGRRERVNPELVPLLRGQSPVPAADDLAEFGEPDQLDAARGLAAGALLSAPIWVCVIYIGRWLLS